MPLFFNIRHLDKSDLQLEGELPAGELDMEFDEEMAHPSGPLTYDLNVQRLENDILVAGRLQMSLKCECVRCLKPFEQVIELQDWTALLPLEGEEKVAINNDLVDLTPHIREDILLAFPQHPLCDAECAGLPEGYTGKKQKAEATTPEQDRPGVWSELNKLKL